MTTIARAAPVACKASCSAPASTSARLATSLSSGFNGKVSFKGRRTASTRLVAAVTSAAAVGDSVTVPEDIMIYHVPKLGKEGFNLKGLQGTITEDVSEFKGKPSNATFPYRVTFETEKDDKKVKFVVHMVPEEFTVV
eukprot:CAMPEP_0182912616 /NCGR_PEP_ID=MMETSP0034_2-20130328/37607_1 /TAXON_ID=156128 /ORGANISM="Nephroselmis pyriformis, Strain CCMP717" /LENGTH=137 /DNA_ID=CAMNT_0025049293 /DNA_START=80 /DNA_END=493 /DNA_ORIENTATION=+